MNSGEAAVRCQVDASAVERKLGAARTNGDDGGAQPRPRRGPRIAVPCRRAAPSAEWNALLPHSRSVPMSVLRFVLLFVLLLAGAPASAATSRSQASRDGEATLQARTDLLGAEAARQGTGLELTRIREDRLRDITSSAGAVGLSGRTSRCLVSRAGRRSLSPPSVPPAPALLDRLPYDATAPPAFV
jgi:hypothetical protein